MGIPARASPVFALSRLGRETRATGFLLRDVTQGQRVGAWPVLRPAERARWC